MNGKLILTHSTNWNLLTNSVLQKIGSANQVYYSWVYITRTAGRANYLKKRFLGLNAGKSTVLPPIFSWNQFLNKIFDQLPVTKQLLSPTDQMLLIHETVQALAEKLSYFSLTDRPFSPQIINSLQSMLNAYFMRHPTEGLPGGEGGDPFGKELESIISGYRKSKGDGFWDESDLLNFILRNDEGRLQNIFPETNRLVWEIDAPVYPLQIKLMDRLKKLGWQVEILLFHGSNPDFFDNMNETYGDIQKIAAEVRRIDDPANFAQTIYCLTDQKLHPGKELEIARFPDRIKEVEEIIKRIKRELIDTPADETNIGITAADISRYLPLLINALSKYGVPFTVSGQVLLSEMLPIQHLQLPLEFVHENGELSVLKRLLKSPFFKYHDNVQGIPFEEILNSLRTQFDLTTILHQLRRSIEYDENNASERRDDKRIGHKRTLLATLTSIRDDIEPLTKPFTAEDFFNFFTSRLQRHHMVKRILDWRQNLALKNVADILGAIRLLITGLDMWRNLMNRLDSQRQFQPSQTLHLFKLIISSFQYQPYQPDHYGIQIFPLHAAELMDLDKLYVMGLSEDAFPAKDQQVLHNLPKPFSQLLSHSRMLDDRRLFLKLLQMPQKSLRLSYAEREGESLKVASNLILELERLTDTKTSIPEPETVFSKSEILSLLKNEIERGASVTSNFPTVTATELHHYKRQVKIVKIRNTLGQPYGIYEGNISSEKTITEFLAHQFETRAFSVSALENYARSPIQYFFSRILYIDEPEVFEDWMTPAEKGKMVHRVLFRFYTELAEQDRSLENLLKIADQEIEKFPFLPSILWDLQKEAFLGSEQRTGLFAAFLDYETRQRQTSPSKPHYFEVPFGRFSPKMRSELSPGFDQPFEITGPETSLKLRGIVDRIELTPDGGILIIDYKTGMIARVQEIEQGKSLQLPLYLQAITHFLKTGNGSYYPLGGCYYQIKDENAIKKEILFAEGKHGLDAKIIFPTNELGNKLEEITLQDFLERCNTFAIQYAKGIRQGRFQHHENTKDCEMGEQNICPQEPLCRVNRAKLRELR